MITVDRKPKGELQMKEVLNRLVKTLVAQYIEACSQEKPDFGNILITFNEFLLRYQTYKTKEKTIYENQDINDLFISQNFLGNFILANIKNIPLVFEGAIFELMINAKLSAKEISSFASATYNLHHQEDQGDDDKELNRGLADLITVYDITKQLFDTKEVRVLDDSQIQKLMSQTHHSAALRGLSLHYKLVADDNLIINGDDIKVDEDKMRVNGQYSQYFAQQYQIRLEQEDLYFQNLTKGLPEGSDIDYAKLYGMAQIAAAVDLRREQHPTPEKRQAVNHAKVVQVQGARFNLLDLITKARDNLKSESLRGPKERALTESEHLREIAATKGQLKTVVSLNKSAPAVPLVLPSVKLKPIEREKDLRGIPASPVATASPKSASDVTSGQNTPFAPLFDPAAVKLKTTVPKPKPPAAAADVSTELTNLQLNKMAANAPVALERSLKPAEQLSFLHVLKKAAVKSPEQSTLPASKQPAADSPANGSTNNNPM